MVLCGEACSPCCDYCLYSMHELIPIDGKMIMGGPIGCFKHSDIEHQRIAEDCGFCEDFHCKCAVEKENRDVFYVGYECGRHFGKE